MSAAASLAFPGGRTLAGWRRQLAAHAPECFWAGYLSFHRVEAPVLVEHRQKLPPFEFLVLKAAASQRDPISPTNLASWLHLETGLIQSMMHALVSEGLLVWRGKEAELTNAGRGALASADFPKARRERFTLYFWHADWGPSPSHRFVHLPHPERVTWMDAPPTAFAQDQLRESIHHSLEWKQQHSFPTTILELLCKPPGHVEDGLEQVILATPLRCFAVVARTRGMHGTILLGFSVNVRSWEMHATAPALRVPEDQPGWIPPVLSEEAVRHAFVEWARQRDITVEDSQNCRLRLEGQRLCVETSSSALNKLRGTQGESWLLAGEGLVRAALQLEFV